MGNIINENQVLRVQQSYLAEQIIIEEMALFHKKQNEQRAMPLIKAIKNQSNDIVCEETAKLFAKIGPNLAPGDRQKSR